MAERRMFAKTIIDSDSFLDMPLSAQCLYFHLSMRADDEGFVNNPRKIMRMIGASDDDARILIAKRFLIAFESGVVVIKHWRIHNYIQKDRYHPTKYKEEKAQLFQKDNGGYTLYPECIQDASKMDTEVRLELGKDSIYLNNTNSVSKKENISNTKKGTHKFVPPTLEDVKAYCQERNNGVDPNKWYDHYLAVGWKVGKNPMKDWKAAVRKWEEKKVVEYTENPEW
jgi:hypothetical protein